MAEHPQAHIIRAAGRPPASMPIQTWRHAVEAGAIAIADADGNPGVDPSPEVYAARALRAGLRHLLDRGVIAFINPPKGARS